MCDTPLDSVGDVSTDAVEKAFVLMVNIPKACAIDDVSTLVVFSDVVNMFNRIRLERVMPGVTSFGLPVVVSARMDNVAGP